MSVKPFVNYYGPDSRQGTWLPTCSQARCKVVLASEGNIASKLAMVVAKVFNHYSQPVASRTHLYPDTHKVKLYM